MERGLMAGWVHGRAAIALGVALGFALLGVGRATAGDPGTEPLATPLVSGGSVSAVALSGHTAYLGGTFSYLGGDHSGPFVVFDQQTEEPLPNWPTIESDGTVYATLPDGSGGWYVGGDFRQVDSTAAGGLAHIKADGTVDEPWDAQNGYYDGTVYALATHGSKLYVGGSFQASDGSGLQNLEILDTATGRHTTWFPRVDSTVTALAVSGSTLYIGGSFSTVDATTRHNLAAFDTSTGDLTSWNPDPDGSIAAIAVSDTGKTVYLGGSFTHVRASARAHAAAVAAAGSGPVTGWAPEFDGPVNALALDGSTLFVGGSYSTVGTSVVRHNLAAVSVTTGDATSWNPNVDGPVNAIAISASIVYAGGSFRTVNGSYVRDNIADFSETTGHGFGIDAVVGGPVYAVAASASAVVAGGDFVSLGGVRRPYLGAVDLESGEPTSFAPQLDGPVSALALSSSTLYAGGTFSTADAKPRLDAAAFSTTTGRITPWNPEAGPAGAEVLALTVSGSTVYLGGAFSVLNGSVARQNLAAADAGTGDATSWNPGADDVVRALAVSGSTVYAGGDFTQAGGATRSHAAAIDASGAATSWDPDIGGSVDALVAASGVVYAGGTFSFVNGSTARGNAAAFDATTGTATSWDPEVSSTVHALALSDSTISAGGAFTRVNGSVGRNNLAAFDTANGVTTAWDPDVAGPVAALAASPSFLVAGGAFTEVGAHSRSRFDVAAYEFDPVATMTASATDVPNGALHRTLSFTFKAGAAGLANGALTLAVPPGWSPPSTAPTAPGYVSVGVGTVSVSNRTIVVSGITRAPGQTLVLSYGSKRGGGSGATAPTTAGPQTWQAKQKTTSGGTLAPLAVSPSVTVLSQDGAGTVVATASSVTRSSTTHTIAFMYTAATGGLDNGAVTITVPAGWSSPSTTPTALGHVVATTGTVTVAGRTITVTRVTRAEGTRLIVYYGDKNSGSFGATAPSTPGTQVWQMTERSSGGGTLTKLAASPSITVR